MASNIDQKTIYLYCRPPVSEERTPNAQSNERNSSSSSSSSSASSDEEACSKNEILPCHNNSCKKIWSVVLMAKRLRRDKKLTERSEPKKLNKEECCRRRIEPYQVTQLCPQCQDSCMKGNITVHRTLESNSH